MLISLSRLNIFIKILNIAWSSSEITSTLLVLEIKLAKKYVHAKLQICTTNETTFPALCNLRVGSVRQNALCSADDATKAEKTAVRRSNIYKTSNFAAKAHNHAKYDIIVN